ncbi:TIM44-like domain-containing protein [Pseudomonas sp. NW5]|uniref:Tim44 domain-containing protein n=1 Tax=Pseudomonas sp. NW5 TaxID=2934934 RepID=UPI0020225909|nr:TIM44-like domain-containing protein [Pseudomonas sp. NW5]MCL7463259.1 TIM44-like domain-containing protein [Pseudomonas sp. NW5]
MQRFLSFALALCLSLTVAVEAHAKRMGGGKSFGAAPAHQTQPRQAVPSAPAATPAAAGAAAAARPASGASRWLGPLAGIAAGGLLASMFMGDGFEGLQIFDFLMVGGLVLLAFLALRALARRKLQAQAATPAYAGAGAGVPPQAPLQTQAYQAPQPAYTPAATTIFDQNAAPASAPLNAPAWFNAERFIAAGREHFMSLQQHWDAGEMDKIAEFVTPELLDFLKQERANLGEGLQSTYIDNLQVFLEGVEQQAGTTVATLTFEGVAKTSRFEQGEAFSESWRLERAEGESQPWLVAGIRQNG